MALDFFSMTVIKIYWRYCLSCQRTLYYPLYKVSAVKRNHNDNKDDDVPPEAFLLMDNLMLEVIIFVLPSTTMNVNYWLLIMIMAGVPRVGCCCPRGGWRAAGEDIFQKKLGVRVSSHLWLGPGNTPSLSWSELAWIWFFQYAIGGSLVFLVVLMIVSFCFKSYLGCSDYSRRETSYQKLWTNKLLTLKAM